MTSEEIVLENVKKHFPVKQGFIHDLLNKGEKNYIKAVDGVSMNLAKGESVGLAGESGCGKTTLAKTILMLHTPTSGNIFFGDQDVTELDKEELRELRQDAQIIYQDPFESINPRFTVREWVREPLEVHQVGRSEQREDRVIEMLEKVNLEPPEHFIDKYPSRLSGGERQRVVIARALITEPSFVVGDEPASMLDVSIRADILKLLKRLENDINLTSLYISHDLSLLQSICDRIAIMYLGKIVEVGPTDEVIQNPKHPYTKALLAAVPRIDTPNEGTGEIITGQVPDPQNIPSHCRFYDRCPDAMDECLKDEPPLIEVSKNHKARCILYDDHIG